MERKMMLTIKAQAEEQTEGRCPDEIAGRARLPLGPQFINVVDVSKDQSSEYRTKTEQSLWQSSFELLTEGVKCDRTFLAHPLLDDSAQETAKRATEHVGTRSTCIYEIASPV
jgi:hypothetical protein